MENTSRELAADSMFTALVQLMKEKEYGEITVTDIVKRAGYSRMAFYRNYKSKDEILLNRLKNKFDYFLQRIESEDISDELELWTDFFDAFTGDEIIMYVYKAGLHSPMNEMHEQYTMKYFEKHLGWDMDDEMNRMKAYKRMGSVTGLMIYYLKNHSGVSPRELARLVLEGKDSLR